MWVDFLKETPMETYPAVAFAPPDAPAPVEPPLYRPKLPKPLPKASVAFGGSPRIERALPAEPVADGPVRVLRAVPVPREELERERELSSRVFVRENSEPWAEGNGFRVGPRSVVRVARAIPVD